MKFHYIKEVDIEIKDDQIKTYCDEYRKSRGVIDKRSLPNEAIMKNHAHDFDNFYHYWVQHGIQIIDNSEERITMENKIIKVNNKLY